MEDKRKKERIAIEKEEDVQFRILVDGARIEVCEIQDISPFGAGVTTSTGVSQGTQVQLQVQTRDKLMNVDGHVVWGRSDEDVYRLGLVFSPGNMDTNLAFFHLLTTQ